MMLGGDHKIVRLGHCVVHSRLSMNSSLLVFYDDFYHVSCELIIDRTSDETRVKPLLTGGVRVSCRGP